MEVGSLLYDTEHGDVGLIIKIDKEREKEKMFPRHYLVLNCDSGKTFWVEEDYILNQCEIIDEDW